MERITPANFIEEFIVQDIEAGKVQHILTRFPPEPNGYLHIGHIKAVVINFLTAQRFGGKCNLRFDDTNPAKEDTEYVEAIKADIRWLGFEWAKLLFGSSYFDECYALAEKLIEEGFAYVDDLSQEEMREYRGTLTAPGRNSPFRDRPTQENLDLFRRMRKGEFPDGARVLRAKIDMASPNMNLRDPALYRIMHRAHHQTGDTWCIYPMYDFAHPIQDAIEGITHSLCSLEYEDHRPLYDWVIERCRFDPKPRQIEFSRLNITNTILSKRYLRRLVEEGYVSGWDDPRMPTLVAMRRKGYPPSAIREFIDRAGVAKADSVVDSRLLDFCVREVLNETAPRAMAVIDPIPVTVVNYPKGQTENLIFENHPAHEEMGTHETPFSRELYIEREDFMIDPPGKFFRLKPGGEVRLRGAYIVKCVGYDVDESGRVTHIDVEADLESRSGMPGSARKVKGTLHWVERDGAIPAKVREYDVMFKDDEADEIAKDDFESRFNRDSIKVYDAVLEPYLGLAQVGDRFQFLRQGYFAKDPDSTPQLPVFNRTVALRDSYKGN